MKYEVPIDPDNFNTSQAQIIKLIGHNKSILNIGCASANLDRFLVKNGCRIVGIEEDIELAKEAQKICDKVIIGNVEEENTLNQIEGDFEVIILSHILEHLIDPGRILSKIRKFLSPKGFLLVALPNVAHWSIRKMLLLGRFTYAEHGLLDRTHLRFFTLESAKKMFKESNYQIDYFGVGSRLPLTDRIPVVKGLKLFNYILPKFLGRLFPNLFGYEFIFKLRAVK